MYFGIPLAILLSTVRCTVSNEELDMLAAFAVAKTGTCDLWEGANITSSMSNLNVCCPVQSLVHNNDCPSIERSDSSDFEVLNLTAQCTLQSTLDPSTSYIDSGIADGLSSAPEGQLISVKDAANGLFLCLGLSQLDDERCIIFLQYCYERTHRTDFLEILCDYILKNVFIGAPKSHALVHDASLLGMLVTPKGLGEAEATVAQITVRKLIGLMSLELLERNHATVTLKNQTYGLKISRCAPEHIVPLLQYLGSKMCVVSELRHVVFEGMDFDSDMQLLSCVSQMLVRRTRVLRFVQCRFPDNTFRLSVEATAALSHLQSLRIESCNLVDIDESLGWLINLKILSIRGHQFKYIPISVYRLTGLTTLEFQSGTLKTIDQRICGLVNLTKLVLSANKLNCISGHITKMQSLRHLVMARNGIAELPESISRLVNLERLNLEGNRLCESRICGISLPALTELSLKANNLTRLPDFVYELGNLTRLMVALNNLTDLGENFSKYFPRLTALDLSKNKFEIFPAEVTRLPDLADLAFVSNRLTAGSFRRDLSPMRSLKKLVLSSNYLGAFPGYLYKLTNLEVLIIKKCGIQNITSELRWLDQLEQLVLCENNFERFPIAVTLLPSLRHLNLSFNKGIRSIPADISRLGNLEIFRMYDCGLVDTQACICTDVLSALTKLKILDLGSNGLTCLSYKIGTLMDLEELRIFGNMISTIPAAIGELRNLRNLNVSNNNLQGLPDTVCRLKMLEILNVSTNPGIQVLPVGISQLSALKTLIAFNIGLTDFPTEVLQLTNLESLNLSKNSLGMLPDDISRLSALKALVLASCGIKKLPNGLSKLRGLTLLCLFENSLEISPWDVINELHELVSLNLSKTNLKGLPESLSHFKRLDFLSVSMNQLTWFPKSILDLVSLTKLHIHNNPCLKQSGGERKIIKSYLKNLIEYKSNDGSFDKAYFDKLMEQSNSGGVEEDRMSVGGERRVASSAITTQEYSDGRPPQKKTRWNC